MCCFRFCFWRFLTVFGVTIYIYILNLSVRQDFGGEYGTKYQKISHTKVSFTYHTGKSNVRR